MSEPKITDDDVWTPCEECEQNIHGMMEDMMDATVLQAITMTLSIASIFEHHAPPLLMRLADDLTTQALFQFVKTGKKRHYADVMQKHVVNVLDNIEQLKTQLKEADNAVKVRKAASGNAGGGARALNPGDPTEGSA